MHKKELQKKRMMGYFIEAANQIIDNEGIENVSIRKIADIAGYNSATIYNYFENLDHLIFFACMKYLKEYVSSLPKYLESINDPIDRYISIWKAFLYHSFKNPKIYHNIFFNRFSDSLDDAIKKYYAIFPEELGSESDELHPMLLGHDIYTRNLTILKSCLNRNYFGDNYDECVNNINEVNVLVFQAMLNRVLNKQSSGSIDENVNKTITHIKHSVDSYMKMYN